MARCEKVVCDKCRAVRGESNHWLVVVLFRDWRLAGIITADDWECLRRNDDAWRRLSEYPFEWKDACGRVCALALQEGALALPQEVKA